MMEQTTLKRNKNTITCHIEEMDSLLEAYKWFALGVIKISDMDATFASTVEFSFFYVRLYF